MVSGPFVELHQVIQQLTREELEAYCFVNAITLAVLGPMAVGCQVDGVDILSTGENKLDDIINHGGVVSAEVRDKIEQLRQEKN